MMSALPQAATQTGIASVLAGLGSAPAADGAEGGFESLFARLPGVPAAALDGAAPSRVTPASLAAIATTTNIESAAAPASDAPLVDDCVEPDAAVPAAPVAGATSDDAAAAASLLIAATTGFGDAAKPGPSTPVAGDDADRETDAELPAANDDVDVPTVLAAPLAAQLPAAGASAKPAPARATPNDDARTPAAPKSTDAPRPTADASPILSDPKAAKTAAGDSGAAMAVLFAQPAVQGAASTIQSTAPAPIAERSLDMMSDDAWIAQLASDIAATKSENGDISFRLVPRHLGRLDVAMTSGAEGMSLKLDTQHEATAQVVHAAQGKLVDDLRQQGVRVAGAEVTCTPGETGRQSQGHGRAPASNSAHLIETANERALTREDEHTADRRGRFA